MTDNGRRCEWVSFGFDWERELGWDLRVSEGGGGEGLKRPATREFGIT